MLERTHWKQQMNHDQSWHIVPESPIPHYWMEYNLHVLLYPYYYYYWVVFWYMWVCASGCVTLLRVAQTLTQTHNIALSWTCGGCTKFSWSGNSSVLLSTTRWCVCLGVRVLVRFRAPECLWTVRGALFTVSNLLPLHHGYCVRSLRPFHQDTHWAQRPEASCWQNRLPVAPRPIWSRKAAKRRPEGT